ncbi:hypothetical protein QEV83_09380 [Methylocapsa sp. D3K7]|uniref:hypothetical protein n=1 Tax=Methylocapsa sp. D3K7 TaxID=3041435 RepID=UPI00244E8FDC|nr:hypothetical protein [Methylocapsa sp. D3K7]WGJ16418.1 hypothetical protein QEV83_09380 [Methylocapsa sp. D3K7]
MNLVVTGISAQYAMLVQEPFVTETCYYRSCKIGFKNIIRVRRIAFLRGLDGLVYRAKRKTRDFQIEIQVWVGVQFDQARKLEREKIRIPTREFRESIVGNSESFFLHIIEMIEVNHRDALEAQELCRCQSAMARD